MRSIFTYWWSLADALAWRLSFEPKISLEQAFDELRALGADGHAHAIGIRFFCRLDRPPAREPFAPLQSLDDLPEEIPSDEWPGPSAELDNQRPIGRLVTTYTHLPAWGRVEIARDALVEAWRPLISEAVPDQSDADTSSPIVISA